MILACVVLTQYQRVTVWHTDGRTDIHSDDSYMLLLTGC